MGLRTLVIVNPKSANGGTGRRWPEIKAALDRVLERWDPAFTEGPRDATRLARQAVRDGYEALVAVGGDGTMSELVAGLFEDDAEAGITDRLIRKDVVVSPVRAGTGGDFARLLGLPHKLPEMVAHLASGTPRLCDLGLLEYTRHDGRTARTAFLNIASFGLSGLVDEKVNASSKALGGTASFMLGLGKALLAYRPVHVEIRVDGEDFYSGELLTCAVANGQYFGGGMRFAPNAAVDDGLFDVVAQVSAGLREYVGIRDLYTGRMIDWPSVRHTRGRLVEARSTRDERVLLDVDGEAIGMLPAASRILPDAVRLLA
ncbi:MAG: diacylglycerol kinase family lipid kinase [Deltaproteobacteria bacterium]|nr:diacylglycerol kinase family lipid kinase [Deltaproteobacteria bacterium]